MKVHMKDALTKMGFISLSVRFIYILLGLLYLTTYVESQRRTCPFIFEVGRQRCNHTTRGTCEDANCCWDRRAQDRSVQCHTGECAPGYFGWGCRFKCECKDDGPCDRRTGECTTTGCADSSWGIGCLLDNECSYNDRAGSEYLGKKFRTLNGHICGSWTLQNAYPDEQFPDKTRDDAENFCRNPKPSDHRPWCYYQFGSRRRWDYCTLKPCDCPLGRYGVNCLKECHCADSDEACDPLDGSCRSGCDPRWMGSGCQECMNGHFGEYCDSECRCQDDQEACNKTTGFCDSGCAAGWTGDSCQQECQNGRFGYNCAYSCNCEDDGEACNKKTGECESGCIEGFAGKDCQIMLPTLSRKPTSNYRDATTITVQWDAWEKPPDAGDGPVTSYFVTFKKKADNEWETIRSEAAQPSYQEIFSEKFPDLDENTVYQFKVLPIHVAGYVGAETPVLEVSTCGVPFSGPLEVYTQTTKGSRNLKGPGHGHVSQDVMGGGSRDDEDQEVLTVEWENPPAKDWNCMSIEGYRIYLKNMDREGDFVEAAEADSGDRRVSINEVDVFSNYKVGVTFINNADKESNMTVVNFLGKSGPVENLEATAESTSTLLITWDQPSEIKAPIKHYIIRYRAIRVSDCKQEKASWSPKIDVTADVFEHEILDLEPYSKVQVKIWAENEAGKGARAMVTGETMPAEPEVRVTNFELMEVRADFARFSWESSNCRRHHGEYRGYSYAMRVGENVVKTGTVNDTELMLEDLTPYTGYSIQVWFINHYGKGPKMEPMAFQTMEDLPPPPSNVHFRMRLSDELQLAWDPPNPPNGELKGYDVKFWSSISEEQTLHMNANTRVYVMENLMPNTSYVAQVRAYTGAGTGDWSEPIFGFTEEAYPGKPEVFRNMSRTSRSITFQWEGPQLSHGTILSYKILCSPMALLGQFLARDVQVIVNGVVHEKTIVGLQPGTKYVCTLRAANRKGYSEPLRDQFWTEPEIEISLSPPIIDETKSTDQSVVVILEPSRTLNNEDARSTHRIVVEKARGGKNSENEVNKDRRRREAKPDPCGDESQLVDYQRSIDLGLDCYIAAEIPDVKYKREFVVGDNQTYNGYYNAPLERGESYDVWFGVMITVDGVTASSYTKTPNVAIVSKYVQQPEGADAGVLAGVAIGALIVLILLAVIVTLFVIKKKRESSRNRSGGDLMENGRMNGSPKGLVHEKVVLPDLCSPVYGEAYDPEREPLYGNVDVESLRRPVAIENLWAYAQEMKTNRGEQFKQEYDEIPLGLHAKHDVARRPENKLKNRYGNIVAYDHTRVIMDQLPGELHSDYINGNYIDGYRKPNAFVATQGPSKYTLNDIWRMTWQLNSSKIIMVTNLVEDGRSILRNVTNLTTPVCKSVEHKCEQYWPEGEARVYGDITVEMTDTEHFADYVIRSFNLTKDEELKLIKQFHFTAWPDHGVPTYATSLLAFRKKIRGFDDPMSGPTIVHCSAGVGRTGTYIALDFLLDQAKVEGQVDIYNCVQVMRTKRVNMVQTQEQYEFVYDALLEALKSGDTSIPCNDFSTRYDALLAINPDTDKTYLQEEYDLLATMTPQTESTCKDAHDPENTPKNRVQEIVPINNLVRPYLLTYIPGATDYINAVFTDGYKQRDAFIMTQMPLPSTKTDFWVMMFDHDVKTIVMLNNMDPNDTTCENYFPDEVGQTQNYGPFSVETTAVESTNSFISTREITLTYNKRGVDEPQYIHQFVYRGWSSDEELPSDKVSMIQMLEMVEKWQQRSGNGPILVHCMDGATRSGLFCACNYMVERLKIEQEVDVFQSVKHSRINRPQLVPTVEQYKFLYDMAVEYMECFQTYANFK